VAEQGIAVLLSPVGEVLDEVLNLLTGSFSKRSNPTEISRIDLDKVWIQLTLADDLA
jgi:hypothetical protein